MSQKVANAFWRMAGLSYLDYLEIAARSTRSVLKEPVKSNQIRRAYVSFNRSDGNLATKVPFRGLENVESLAKK